MFSVEINSSGISSLVQNSMKNKQIVHDILWRTHENRKFLFTFYDKIAVAANQKKNVYEGGICEIVLNSLVDTFLRELSI